MSLNFISSSQFSGDIDVRLDLTLSRREKDYLEGKIRGCRTKFKNKFPRVYYVNEEKMKSKDGMEILLDSLLYFESVVEK